MTHLTLGEDTFAVLISVFLILIFISVLHSSFSIQEARKKKIEKTKLLLTISEIIKNHRFSDDSSEIELGVIKDDKLREKIPQFIEKLKKERIRAQIKIISIKNKILFTSKKIKENSPKSISIPIIYEKENEFLPANMIIKIGG